MNIAQITDLHVVARDRLWMRRVPTNAQVAEAVAHINALDPRPDVVIVSGDLTDHGRDDEYEMLREILSKLAMPYFLIPGNHDRREPLLKHFADRPHMPPVGSRFVQYAVDEYPIRLIGLDTIVPEQEHGEMCAERLRWLDETLSARPQHPTIIFMHHPPFRTGIRWMDAYGLYGGREMEHVVSRHRQVLRVACGHIHRPIFVQWAGTIASVAPSTCHQVSLAINTGIDFVMEPRCVELHTYDPAYGLVTHTSYVPNNYDRTPMLDLFKDDAARASFLGRVGKDYEAMRRLEYEAGGLTK